jgi:predicted SprT family Zn-dependent metalloprotease
MMHLKLLEKQEQTKPQTSRWREMIKIRAKINEIETKLHKESMKQKVDFSKRLAKWTNP